jgi:prepilin-type N-terminal cleavage/methylation domain-containing protein
MHTRPRTESGFSLVEMLVATTLLLVVSSIVTSALLQMTKHQQTISNRTEMHSGVRGATELLQQEVGQAGRVTLPTAVTIGGAGVTAPAASCDPGAPLTGAINVTVNSTAGMFASAGPPAAYETLTVLDGDNQESIKVAAIIGATTFQACFTKTHPAGALLMPLGGFATGIIPPTGVINGSTPTTLKLFGDINGDGNMVYVEYFCDSAGTHNLYRNVMPFDTPLASKPALTDAMILLSNVHDNPPDASGTARPCFDYQTKSQTVQSTDFTFVLDVAVTLTVWTQQVDSVTQQFQKETKALLNISPRNVFTAWNLASIGYTDHIQSTPTTVAALLTP